MDFFKLRVYFGIRISAYPHRKRNIQRKACGCFQRNFVGFITVVIRKRNIF